MKNIYRKVPPAYYTWQHIKQRCGNKNCHKYRLYGARGITYPEKWKTYGGFWEDMGKGWKRGLSIDRIDNSKSYSKENCRWATPAQQARNTRRNVLIKHGKHTLTKSEWARRIGISPSLLSARITKLGWDIKKHILRGKTDMWSKKLTTSDKEKIRKLYSNGRTQVEIAALFGVHQANISRIINNKQ